MNYAASTCEKYKRYLPSNNKSEGQAWWVIQHESVIDDTCAMLKKLGLECPTEYAIGQRIRKEVQDNITCEKPDMTKEITCINDLNKSILKRSVTH